MLHVLLICGLGLLCLYSASLQRGSEFVVRQLWWVVLGAVVCWAMARIDYHRWLEAAYLGYGLALVLLAAIPLVGRTTMGASRWIDIAGVSVQPSELAKLATIFVLARRLAVAEGLGTSLAWSRIISALAIAAVPALLIFKEPDLGSATVVLALTVGMLWVAGMSRRQGLTLAAIALVLLPVGWHVLKPYQRARLLVFTNPNVDPLGAGYTIIQSKIAIGSGGLVGKGWLAGTQNQLNFLPERHTDFIFSVIGEEWGFAGTLVVIGLFAWLIWRGCDIARQQQDRFGRLLATGVVVALGYQMVVNIGMVSGMLPVVGVPLPFISYGGSSMVTTFLAVGLLESVRRGAS